MKSNASISEINEPVGLIKSKACQEVAWSVIPEGRISKASTTQVEEHCDAN